MTARYSSLFYKDASLKKMKSSERASCSSRFPKFRHTLRATLSMMIDYRMGYTIKGDIAITSLCHQESSKFKSHRIRLAVVSKGNRYLDYKNRKVLMKKTRTSLLFQRVPPFPKSFNKRILTKHPLKFPKTSKREISSDWTNLISRFR